MHRGGFPAKTLVLALFVVGTIYLLYLYNTTLGRLRDAELSAERYRREEETKVAQLQEVMRNKDDLQERCENDKREFTNRLNSLNQQHKMLKSQYDEHEVEQMRLEQEARRVKEEFEQVETQRNQEYQQLKQQKELEISTLRDLLADAQRQNADLQSQITSLRTQIQNGQQQLANKQVELEQQRLQQQQQFGNQNLNFQQQPQQQNIALNPNQQQQQNFMHQQQQQGVEVGQALASMNMRANLGDANNLAGLQQHNQGAQLHAGMAQGVFGDAQNQIEHQQRVEELNAQHQVLPPHGNSDNLVQVNPDAAVNRQREGNNEDHQVRPPNLNAANERMDDNDEDGVVNQHLHRQAGGPLNKHVEDVEEAVQHQDPLELKQMEPPNLKLDGLDQMEQQRQGAGDYILN